MIRLIELKEGEQGKVVALEGGGGFLEKLDAMGIRIGTVIQKQSAQFMRGPVCFKVGQTCLAIGYGMARKIILEKVA